jgi:hypothetical protein
MLEPCVIGRPRLRRRLVGRPKRLIQQRDARRGIEIERPCRGAGSSIFRLVSFVAAWKPSRLCNINDARNSARA